jgi:hypothetical protein
MPDLHQLGRDERAEAEEEQRLSALCQDQQPLPIHAIGDGSADEAQRDVRHRLHQSGDAQH